MKGLYITIFIFLIMAFTACKKAPGPANGHSISPNNNLDSMVSVSVLIDSQKWQTDSAFAYLIQTSGNDSLITGLMINCVKTTGNTARSINFYITNFSGPGIYLINPPYNTATYYVGTARNYATLGQIVITSDTAYSLIGTFNFIAGTDTISNGVFNVAMP